MRKYKFAMFGIVATLILGCATINKMPKIDKAEFGFLSLAQDGSIIFLESERVPLKVGTPYGWRIHMTTDKDELTWKEVLMLPSPPQVWGHKGHTKIDDHGKVAITEKTVQIENGWIGNGWSVAEGDPPGTYVIEIYIEGILVKRFSFILE